MLSSTEKSKKNLNASENDYVARLAESLKKRQELTSKAVKVVEMLIDNPVSEAALQNGCKHINQFYYKDLTEERAVVFNCGYPLCSNKLKNMKSQRFHISYKHKKVFDITERKNFCSNICFKASKYLENQLSSAELWLKERQKVRFLSLDVKSGIPGEEIDLGEIKPVGVDDLSLQHDLETLKDELVEGLKAVSLSDSAKSDKELPSEQERSLKDEPTIRSKDRTLQMKSKGSVSKSESLTIIEVLERILKEWLTVESMKYLFEFEKCDEFVEGMNKKDREKIQKEIEDDLSRKLDIQEREDEILDRKIIREGNGDFRSYKRVLKKPPSYDKLLKDGDRFALKVNAFYEGDTLSDVPLVATREKKKEANLKVFERNDSDGMSSKEGIGNRHSQVPLNINLPVVDPYEQIAVRRKIVLEKLSYACSTHLRVLGFSYKDIGSDLRMLVHTFRLTATNITFKSPEWLTLSIIVIKLLTFRSVEIQDAFTLESTNKYLNSILEPFKLDLNHLNVLLDRVLDTNNLTASRKDLGDC